MFSWTCWSVKKVGRSFHCVIVDNEKSEQSQLALELNRLFSLANLSHWWMFGDETENINQSIEENSFSFTQSCKCLKVVNQFLSNKINASRQSKKTIRNTLGGFVSLFFSFISVFSCFLFPIFLCLFFAYIIEYQTRTQSRFWLLFLFVTRELFERNFHSALNFLLLNLHFLPSLFVLRPS